MYISATRYVIHICTLPGSVSSAAFQLWDSDNTPENNKPFDAHKPMCSLGENVKNIQTVSILHHLTVHSWRKANICRSNGSFYKLKKKQKYKDKLTIIKS